MVKKPRPYIWALRTHSINVLYVGTALVAVRCDGLIAFACGTRFPEIFERRKKREEGLYRVFNNGILRFDASRRE
jgi:hypothetical protein